MSTVKFSLRLTQSQARVLHHILRNFHDYCYKDDRTDHGLAILQNYRDNEALRETVSDLTRTITTFYHVRGYRCARCKKYHGACLAFEIQNKLKLSRGSFVCYPCAEKLRIV